MKLVRFETEDRLEVFVNPEHVATVSPDKRHEGMIWLTMAAGEEWLVRSDLREAVRRLALGDEESKG